MLKDSFWSGLDDDISLKLADEEAKWSLAQFIDSVLPFCGSPFMIGPVDENTPLVNSFFLEGQ